MGPTSIMVENLGQDYALGKSTRRKNKGGISMRALRAQATRPTMHVKEGKLLLTGNVHDKKNNL